MKRYGQLWQWKTLASKNKNDHCNRSKKEQLLNCTLQKCVWLSQQRQLDSGKSTEPVNHNNLNQVTQPALTCSVVPSISTISTISTHQPSTNPSTNRSNELRNGRGLRWKTSFRACNERLRVSMRQQGVPSYARLLSTLVGLAGWDGMLLGSPKSCGSAEGVEEEKSTALREDVVLLWYIMLLCLFLYAAIHWEYSITCAVGGQ